MNLYGLSQYSRNCLFVLCLAGSGPGLWAQATIPGKVPMNAAPTRTFGQAQSALVTGSPNLVEGRELNFPNDVAVDLASKAVYVADTSNNRVLGWRSAGALSNGAPADVILGQRDRFTTIPNGPDAAFKSGLTAPTSVAVDGSGNLYVADSANNRILRYPKPFSQPGNEAISADFVIGQTSVNSGRAPNAPVRSAKSLFLASGTSIFTTGMRFDAGGNLWVTDSGNGRVLRFPATALAQGRPNAPDADLVLGQAGFSQFESTSTPAQKQTMREPAGLAFDSAGRLFVTDLLNRVLVYTPPFSTGGSAQRLMGLVPPTQQGQQPLPPVNEYTIGAVSGSGPIPADGVFTIGDVPFVLDKVANRVLRYAPFNQWPVETEQVSPAAVAVIGQDSFRQTEPKPNRGLTTPGPNRFNQPTKGFFADGKTYIVDASNSRVLVFGDLSTGPATGNTDYQASVALGQLDLDHGGQNLVEGREFSGPNGIAVFTAADGTPQLFVADTNNHRVLGFRDARKVKPGDKADLVIGQADFISSLANSPSNDANVRSATGLLSPRGVAVDKQGNLFVADTNNSRVLRFSQPFSSNFNGTADLVLGQNSFVTAVTDPSSRTMASPIALAFTVEGLLAVADATHNRVLVFSPPFSSGMAASVVVGQADFSSTAVGTLQDRDKLNSPRGVGVDTDDRLYVADFGNNRVQIFGRTPLLANGANSLITIASNQPTGVMVSRITGEIWATEATGIMRRYPKFDTLLVQGGATPDYAIGADSGGQTVGNRFTSAAFDAFNNIYTAEAANRISVYYPFVSICNGASFIPAAAPPFTNVLSLTGLAPSSVATLSLAPDRGCENNTNLIYTFTDKTKSFNELPNPIPMPKVLEDLQVTVDGVPAPLYFISPFQINFQVPKSSPTSGTATVLVTQVSTGRIIGAVKAQMAAASPSLFTLTYERGTAGSQALREVAALNPDGSVNSKEKPIERNQFIQLFATGIGNIPGAPDDGVPTAGELPSRSRTRVVIGATVVEPGADIPYSGLAPTLVGVWQINVKIPDTTPPGQIRIGVSVNDGVNDFTNPTPPWAYATTIWVK
jgi:uncharacterized protein (TIGR03437 family)